MHSLASLCCFTPTGLIKALVLLAKNDVSICLVSVSASRDHNHGNHDQRNSQVFPCLHLLFICVHENRVSIFNMVVHCCIAMLHFTFQQRNFETSQSSLWHFNDENVKGYFWTMLLSAIKNWNFYCWPSNAAEQLPAYTRFQGNKNLF